MEVPHSENPKPSWDGESVGHDQGDTLVIDTVGQNVETVVDPCRLSIVATRRSSPPIIG
jgi:hypothetical protein